MLIQQWCNFKFCPACVFLVGDLHNPTAAELLSCKIKSQKPFLASTVSPCKPKQPNTTDGFGCAAPRKFPPFTLASILTYVCTLCLYLRPFAASHSAPTLRHHSGGSFWWFLSFIYLIPLNPCTLTCAVPVSKLYLEAHMPAFWISISM